MCVICLSAPRAQADDPQAAQAQPIDEGEFVAIEMRLAEIAREGGAEDSRGAADHATQAVRAARVAALTGDASKAARALHIAQAALLVAERQAARARALTALAAATRTRAEAQARALASQSALAAARADHERLRGSEP